MRYPLKPMPRSRFHGFVHPGFVEVKVDEQRCPSRLGEQSRHVGRRKGLSLSRVHAADQDGVLPFAVEQVLQVGPQSPESLCSRVAGLFEETRTYSLSLISS